MLVFARGFVVPAQEDGWHWARLRAMRVLQVDVLVEGWDQDGNVVGRTQWDAPDVDPLVFLHQAGGDGALPLQPGQMRRCLVTGTSLFDLEATPTA